MTLTYKRLRPWVLGLGLGLGLCACRQVEQRLPFRAVKASSGPSGSGPSGSGPSGSTPTPGVDTGPALPLQYPVELEAYLRDTLTNFELKRAETLLAGLEPYEAVEEMIPQPYAVRLEKKLDPIEAHFNAGEDAFELELSLVPGFGDGLGSRPPNFHRVQRGSHGGPDSTSCRGCHHRGGDDGAGEYNEAALLNGDGIDSLHVAERNPPPLSGSGVLQVLASEISAVLAQSARPGKTGETYSINIGYQDVDFGTLTFLPDGRVDTSKITAVDPDLVVRPFGWKGTHSTLRRFAEEAFQVHHGLQSTALVDRYKRFGTLPVGTSPATKALIGALGDGSAEDPDKDHHTAELIGSSLTAISVYLTLLPMPVIDPPRSPDLLAAWRQGVMVFESVGCASCHKPMWTIKNPVWIERGEDQSSRYTLELDLRRDIRNGPPLRNRDLTLSDYPVFVFSDLRRHDMGPELADPPLASESAGPHRGDRSGPHIPPSFFLTRPLWGLADSGPYLHDGRAVTLHEAIVAHGGEAQPVRDAYLKLPVEQQRALQVFLFSLCRQPLPEVSQ